MTYSSNPTGVGVQKRQHGARNSSTRNAGGRAGGRGSSSEKTRFNRVSEEDIDAANQQVGLAFQIAGLVAGGALVCPACGASKKKVQAKANESGRPYWKCQKCKTYGSATKLLQDYRGYTFPDAVNTLLGRPTSGAVRQAPKVKLPEIVIAPPFKAVVDTDVYDVIRNSGSLEAAQAYYSTVAHIDPRFVKEAGSTYITDAKALQRKLVSQFGMERLRAAGVVTLDKNEKDFFLFSDDYCVIEVHERACRDLRSAWVDYGNKLQQAAKDGTTPPEAPFKPPTCHRPVDDNHGHVVGMQFRPSLAQKRKVDEHKAWKKRWSGMKDPETGKDIEPSDAWETMHNLSPEAAGPKVPYVTPFLSLKGATQESLVGCGLRRISELPPGQKVYVVEGFKDLLAARTMGAEAYAIPGTGVLPGEHICTLLRKHTMVVSLDGDEAGAKGREALMEHFEKIGISAYVKPDIREGLDVADILVERFVKTGCVCQTCSRWRQDHS